MYNIPEDGYDNDYGCYLNDLIYEKDEHRNTIKTHPEKLYQAIHNAIDVFIEVYKHCQSLEGIYQFFKNDRNDPRLIPRIIDNRTYTPIRYRGLIALARLTKQPDYESLKKEYIKKDLAWSVKDYLFNKKCHDDLEKSYAEELDDYEPHPYGLIIEGNIEEFFKKELEEYITELEALDVDELLAMDLPKAMDI